MANQIVQVNVSQQLAPTPNKLQQTGAIISQGGTTLPAGTYSLLTSKSSLAALLVASLTLASVTSSGTTATATLPSTTIASGTYNATTGLVTLTLAAGITATPGVAVVVSGATGTGSFASINGSFVAGVGSTGTTLTYTIATGLTMTITGGAVAATISLANGSTFAVTIAGANQAGYNGLWLATVTSASTFTYTLAASTTSPATGTITATQAGVSGLVAENTTFWAQGSQTSVYVLELGPGTPAQGVTALNAYITANPKFFYSYLVPASWSSEATYLTMLANYNATTAEVYFFTTMTLANYTTFSALDKCVLGLVESPTKTSLTEFTLAAVWWVTLTYNPGSTNQVPPLAFAYVFGVTPWPASGYGTTLAALRAAGVNTIGTGAEGGISNTIVFWGHMMDNNPFNYWYSIDWMQINVDLDISNAIINGSNTTLNPLYYNQDGINRLQAVGAGTLAHSISYGLALGQVVLTELQQSVFVANFEAGLYAGQAVINAEPFNFYTAENPSDYALGKYDGLTIVYTPLRGFEQIIFNVNVTQFVG